jgi:hypothetical protein
MQECFEKEEVENIKSSFRLDSGKIVEVNIL